MYNLKKFLFSSPVLSLFFYARLTLPKLGRSTTRSSYSFWQRYCFVFCLFLLLVACFFRRGFSKKNAGFLHGRLWAHYFFKPSVACLCAFHPASLFTDCCFSSYCRSSSFGWVYQSQRVSLRCPCWGHSKFAQFAAASLADTSRRQPTAHISCLNKIVN